MSFTEGGRKIQKVKVRRSENFVLGKKRWNVDHFIAIFGVRLGKVNLTSKNQSCRGENSKHFYTLGAIVRLRLD